MCMCYCSGTMLLRPSFRHTRELIAAGLLASLLIAPAWAARTVRVAEVTTVATEPSAAFDEAMRTALIRITGKADADQDPAFSALLGNARRYVQIFRATSNPPGVLVTLDGAAIERAVVAAGKSVWPHDRPVVLVVMAQSPAGSDATVMRAALEQAAALRGLPVDVNDGPIATLSGAEPSAEAALAAARNAGADAVLLGRAQSENSWRWSFYGPAVTESFDGSLASGIYGAADTLAGNTQLVLAQPEAEALVRVDGIASLRDYATVSRLLSALSGVRNVSVSEAGAASATFRLLLRGGVDGLLALLAGESHLRAVSASGGVMVYQYQP